MNMLICAGGTGTRILEALIHLCAAGLGPDEVRTFVIDPDGTNGNGKETRALLDRYQKLHAVFGNGPFGFFKTRIDVLRPPDDNQGLQVWSPVKQHQKFHQALNFGGLSAAQRDVVHLLFTQDELDMEMTIGYQGHPALGAAALALLPVVKNSVPLLTTLEGALQNGTAAGLTNVVIAGSVFGGTGASTIHPMVRYLRSKGLVRNDQNLRVAAVALAPYFQFTSADDTVTREEIKKKAARSENFPLASRSAAEYYHHLRETNDWQFDAMYWIGDDTPRKVKYSPGGTFQENPASFVEMLGAMASLDFFSNSAKLPHGQCWYAGPEVPAGARNMVSFENIPFREEGLFGRKEIDFREGLALFQSAAVAHLGFYRDLLKDPHLKSKPKCVPWYARFRKEQDDLTAGTNAGHLKLLEEYWSNDYLRWWGEVHDAEGRVRLLNKEAWSHGNVSIDRLNNVIYPDASPPKVRYIHSMYENVIAIAKRPPEGSRLDEGAAASRYLTLLAFAACKTCDYTFALKSTH